MPPDAASRQCPGAFLNSGFFVRVLFFAVAVAGCTVAAAALALPAALLGDPHLSLIHILSATNRPVEASVTSICRGMVAIVACSLVLSRLFGMNGVWAAFPVSELLTAVLTLFLLLRGKKQTA